MLMIYFSHLCKVYLRFMMNVNYRQHSLIAPSYHCTSHGMPPVVEHGDQGLYGAPMAGQGDHGGGNLSSQGGGHDGGRGECKDSGHGAATWVKVLV
jgi:hypothetical protein